MDKLLIDAGGSKTPKVDFNPETGVFEIEGISRSENSKAFYDPIVDWLNTYASQPAPQTIFEFKVKYFNTSAAKWLLEVMELLIEIQEAGKTNLAIRWHYMEDDEDMLDAGENYSALLDFEFEFVEE